MTIPKRFILCIERPRRLSFHHTLEEAEHHLKRMNMNIIAEVRKLIAQRTSATIMDIDPEIRLLAYQYGDYACIHECSREDVVFTLEPIPGADLTSPFTHAKSHARLPRRNRKNDSTAL